MPEFLKLIPREQAQQVLLSNIHYRTLTERIPTPTSLGRITGETITSPISMPPFPRSTVDGYAVRAADTYGSSDSLPAYLRLVGEVLMGTSPSFDLQPGEVGLIHTGGMLPDSSNAVVMLEYTQQVGPETIEILRPAAVGENTIKTGEDVKAGEAVIPAGHRIRPAEIGGLAALGILEVTVARKPTVGIISSGDEVVSPEKEILPGQVRDINSYTLSVLLEQAGAIAHSYGILPDNFEALETAAARALGECDALVITAGSSASARDLTAAVINKLGSPGVLVHGVNIKPGKPTILAVCNQKVVIGLPGNPVSALVIAGLFVVPAVQTILGRSDAGESIHFPARLSTNVPSQAGREDWVAAHLTTQDGEYQVDPIFSKSNLIFSLVRANSLIRVPPDATGLSAGELVEVQPLN